VHAAGVPHRMPHGRLRWPTATAQSNERWLMGIGRDGRWAMPPRTLPIGGHRPILCTSSAMPSTLCAVRAPVQRASMICVVSRRCRSRRGAAAPTAAPAAAVERRLRGSLGVALSASLSGRIDGPKTVCALCGSAAEPCCCRGIPLAACASSWRPVVVQLPSEPLARHEEHANLVRRLASSGR